MPQDWSFSNEVSPGNFRCTPFKETKGFCACGPDKSGKIYVLSMDGNRVKLIVFDTKQLSVIDTIPIDSCSYVQNMILSKDEKKLYMLAVNLENEGPNGGADCKETELLWEFDPASRQITRKVDVGDSDNLVQACMVEADGQIVIRNASGGMKFVDTGSFSVVASMPDLETSGSGDRDVRDLVYPWTADSRYLAMCVLSSFVVHQTPKDIMDGDDHHEITPNPDSIRVVDLKTHRVKVSLNAAEIQGNSYRSAAWNCQQDLSRRCVYYRR